MQNASGHHQTSSSDVTRGVRLNYSRPLNLPFLSVLERLDLLCRTDREVALRAAARYISLLLHHHVYVHVILMCTCVHIPLSYCYRRVIDVQRVTCYLRNQ